MVARRIEDKDAGAIAVGQPVAGRRHDGGFGVAERQARIDRLAALQVGRHRGVELHLDSDMVVCHLREDPGDTDVDDLTMDIGGGLLTGRQSRQVEFVDLGAQLVGAFGIDFAQRIALFHRLARLELEIGQPASRRRRYAERVKPLADLAEAATQIAGRGFDLALLAGKEGAVLGLAGLKGFEPRLLVLDLVGEGLHIGVVENALGAQQLTLAQVLFGLVQGIGRVGQLLFARRLLRAQGHDLGIGVGKPAGNVGFARRHIQCQVGIGKARQHLAGRDLRAVGGDHLVDPAGRLGGEIDGVEGHHLGAQRHIVLERAADDRAGIDRRRGNVEGAGRRQTRQDHAAGDDQHGGASTELRGAFFPPRLGDDAVHAAGGGIGWGAIGHDRRLTRLFQ